MQNMNDEILSIELNMLKSEYLKIYDLLKIEFENQNVKQEKKITAAVERMMSELELAKKVSNNQ